MTTGWSDGGFLVNTKWRKGCKESGQEKVPSHEATSSKGLIYFHYLLVMPSYQNSVSGLTLTRPQPFNLSLETSTQTGLQVCLINLPGVF